MIDITNKIDTLRTATAQSILKVSEKSIRAIKNDRVPKGNVFESAKVAGLFAIKNTSNALPHCHPLPVEFADIDFKIKSKNIIEVNVTVKTIYKTGCEMEALHGASVAALTAYDMLKPIDKDIEITNIRLLEKSGGKSENKSYYDNINLNASVIVISDSAYSKKAEDKSGKLIKEKLESMNINTKHFTVIPDKAETIKEKVMELCRKKINLIITTGGTGLSVRDVTPDTVEPLLEREISGVMEAARAFGQKRTPYAMLSRGVAGFIGKTLILTFPGSSNAVKQYFDSLFPYVLHLFKIQKDFKH